MRGTFRCMLGIVFAIGVFGCGDGGDSGTEFRAAGLDSANFGCDGTCGNHSLTAEDVTRILQQAVSAAAFLNAPATIAVTDRVGNVLGLYQMPGAAPNTTINGQIGAIGGLEGAVVPSTFAAISKAGTGAYLSSQGNAFTTRTASQIVQENFNPGEERQPGGPLFGVQFSQLPCSDVTMKSSDMAGPRPLPLGLSADPGGMPLYKQGDAVGGIGIELDGVYRLDRNVTDHDEDIEELIALNGSVGFEIPSEVAGDKIFVGGKSIRTADLSYGDLGRFPPANAVLEAQNFPVIPGFTNGAIRAGVVFGTPESGITRTTRAGVSAAVLTNGGGQRFPTRSGSRLNATEVDSILDSAIYTAFRTRAAIRRPLDTQAHVSIWVVDTNGEVLGMVRTGDAPVFGLDVALQKARAAALFSSADAGDVLSAAGLGGYVSRARDFLGASALTGQHAFTDRAIGNLARPFLPDGINGTAPGPFSLPFPGLGGPRTWSPFNTGLQLDMILGGLVAPLQGTIPGSCAGGALSGRARNGIQIFPGSVPLYSGGVLAGALGISGDGIDQDDLVAFYGASRTGLDLVGHLGVGDQVNGFNAPPEIRADRIQTSVGTTRLRYVNCPESPFRGSNEQRVCEEV